jgi:hypothetical protein
MSLQTITEISMGTRIRFRDGDPDDYSIGNVNATPFITFQDSNGELLAWVPVHVHDGNRNLVVRGDNILGVEA